MYNRPRIRGKHISTHKDRQKKSKVYNAFGRNSMIAGLLGEERGELTIWSILIDYMVIDYYYF